MNTLMVSSLSKFTICRNIMHYKFVTKIVTLYCIFAVKYGEINCVHEIYLVVQLSVMTVQIYERITIKTINEIT